MSSYYQSNIIYGIKLSEQSIDSLYPIINIPEQFSLVNYRNTEDNISGVILGINYLYSSLKEELSIINLDIFSEDNSNREKLDIYISKLFQDYNISQEIVFDLYLVSYLY